MKSSDHRYKTARNITLIGAVANVILAIVKIILGILGRSHALLADGLHSLSDLLTDALVLFASKFGSRDADIDHPYGHQRIETAATMGIAAFLIFIGAGIIWDAGIHLLTKSVDIPEFYVIFIALFSVVLNEFVFYLMLHYGKKIHSNLLIANAWHHRSDALSSLVVLIGVGGALMGLGYLDAVAAIIVGLMIIKMGVSLGWQSVRELVDTGVSSEYLEKIKSVIYATPGVETIHQLRTRSMANHVLIDVHVTVNSYLSVSEGHYIAATVDKALRDQLEKVTDVTVHIDVEDDQVSPLTKQLPSRSQLLPQLIQLWQQHNCPEIDTVQQVNMHYLAGSITIEINMPFSAIGNRHPIDIQKCYSRALSQLSLIKNVRIFFE